jgi:glycerophosphoryl diester phosphodiesterase
MVLAASVTALISLVSISASAAQPLIVAHRGASHDAPENTLPAFRLAWQQGADAIEGDFYRSRDGHVVCIHDKDTERVAGRKLMVEESTLAELRALDVGAYRGEAFRGTIVPTLEEVLAIVPAGKRVYLEVKGDETMVPALLDGVAKSGLEAEQVVVISFNAEVIRAVKIRAPQHKAYWLSGFKKQKSGEVTPTLQTVLDTLKRTKANGFSSSKDLIDGAFIASVKARGYEYHVWTVDDAETGKRFSDWGAGSITTNKPGEMRRGLVVAGEREPGSADG